MGKATCPHPRNTGPMRSSPRCGAKTRAGSPCKSPAVAGRVRCRMHGGSKGSGAPIGNRNALKHGAYTKEAKKLRAEARRLLQEIRSVLAWSEP